MAEATNITNESKKLNYIHILSDSTCHTAHTVTKACTSQFHALGIALKEKTWPMIRTEKALNKVLDFIRAHPGPIVYTLSNFKLRCKIREFAQENQIPYTSPIAQVVLNIARYYNFPLPNSEPGKHLEVNEDYFKKIDCVQYTQEHDDGANVSTINKANIIIVGVSRTSKSPTSFYLAHRGFKVANIPYFHRVEFPIDPTKYKNSLIIGLTINPEVLSLIRTERGVTDLALDGKINSELNKNYYTNYEQVCAEVRHCLRFFTKYEIPYIDVTKKAMEETATEIIKLYEERFGGF